MLTFLAGNPGFPGGSLKIQFWGIIMAVIVTIRVDPITGKSELVGSRLNQASEIWASKGAKTRVAFISMGLNAGQFLFATAFDDFSSTMTAMESVYMDPAMQELMQQREREPGGKMIGPNMFRTIYGELGTLQEKAHLIRYYQMPRHNIPAAIELMGEIDALSDDVNLTAVAPVAHEQMGMIAGVYRFNSMAHAGKAIDEVGMSEGFQNLVNKANTLGTLTSAQMNINM